VSDEPQRTYTAREIVLEFFPATNEKLVPGTEEYRLERSDGGALVIRETTSQRTVTLTPVEQAGNVSTQLCCDLCQRSAPRRYLQVYRLTLPGSHGRRFRYLTLCSDSRSCDARRINDEPLKRLLLQAFEAS
jgi:hypothetical protein